MIQTPMTSGSSVCIFDPEKSVLAVIQSALKQRKVPWSNTSQLSLLSTR